MATLVLRNTKGSPLTNTEMDNNFSNLNTDVGSRVLKSGDVMTGLLTLSADPSSALHAATKQYTDTADAARLQLVGGTMTGKLTTSTVSLSAASLLIGVGSQDPTTPAPGDLWNNGGTLKFQISGSTKTIAFTDSALSGNAASATKLATGRAIALGTDVTGSVSFDGTSDVTIAATVVQSPKLKTARTIAITGDGAWSTLFDGSANASAVLTLASVNANTGTFGDNVTIPVITTNAKGLTTSVVNTAIRGASTGAAGIVTLSDSVSTVSSGLGATSTAVKTAYDYAGTAVAKIIKVYNSVGTQIW